MALNTKETTNFNVVSINLGGMDCNPFEYISQGNANKGVWDFEEHLSGLKKNSLMGYMSDYPEKYKPFKEFVKNLDFKDVFDYMFKDVPDDRLELDNKFGRSDSDIKRFNPVEYGYCRLYYMESDKNQFEYVKDIGMKVTVGSGNDSLISDTLKKCLDVPHLNDMFSLENTKWLSKDYPIDSVFNIILYDMMKTYSVIKNYNIFNTIYKPYDKDTRLDRLYSVLGKTPSIIFTQEGGINKKDTRFKYEAEIFTEGGVKMYSCNMKIDLYQMNNIPDNISNVIGNKKSLDIEFFYRNSLYKICGVHCKEPKNERTYEKLVNEGFTRILKKDYYQSGLVGYFTDKLMDWFYGVKERKSIIIGDFNPKNNEKTDVIRGILKDSFTMYPKKNIITTSKTRSGYCAQKKKFWKESRVCKDIAIVDDSLDINQYHVFPDSKDLLTEKWLGDHSAVILNINV